MLSVNLQHRRLAIGHGERLGIVDKEGRHRIDRVERRVPSLCALALQKPQLHVGNGLCVRRLQALQRLYHSHLCGYAIVTP